MINVYAFFSLLVLIVFGFFSRWLAIRVVCFALRYVCFSMELCTVAVRLFTHTIIVYVHCVNCRIAIARLGSVCLCLSVCVVLVLYRAGKPQCGGDCFRKHNDLKLFSSVSGANELVVRIILASNHFNIQNNPETRATRQ